MGNSGDQFDWNEIQIKNPKRIVVTAVVMTAAILLLAGVKQTFFTIHPEEVDEA